ncbi:MAG: hypothetical protein ACYT04_06995 [Nostoc sp.]
MSTTGYDARSPLASPLGRRQGRTLRYRHRDLMVKYSEDLSKLNALRLKRSL